MAKLPRGFFIFSRLHIFQNYDKLRCNKICPLAGSDLPEYSLKTMNLEVQNSSQNRGESVDVTRRVYGLRILFVGEFSTIQNHIIFSTLSKMGHIVEVVSSCDECIRFMKNYLLDLVFVDLSEVKRFLPNMYVF